MIVIESFKGLNYPNWCRILFRNWMFWFRLHQKFKCSIRNVTCALNLRVYCNAWKITQNSNPSHSIIGTLNNKWRNLWWINLSMKIPHEKCVKIPSIHGRFALKIHHSGGDQLPSIRIWEPLGNCCQVAHPTMATNSLAPPWSTWCPRGGSNPWVGSPEKWGPPGSLEIPTRKPPFFRGFYVSFQGCV